MVIGEMRKGWPQSRSDDVFSGFDAGDCGECSRRICLHSLF